MNPGNERRIIISNTKPADKADSKADKAAKKAAPKGVPSVPATEKKADQAKEAAPATKSKRQTEEQLLKRTWSSQDGTVVDYNGLVPESYLFVSQELLKKLAETDKEKAEYFAKWEGKVTMVRRCHDCGAEFRVASQDMHQKFRCDDCTKKHRGGRSRGSNGQPLSPEEEAKLVDRAKSLTV